MRAAMALAGLTVEELASRIATRGYGTKTLYNMQSDANDRDITPRDIPVLARACDIDEAFFTIDFTDLGRRANDLAVQAQIAALADAVDALVSGRAEDALRAARAATEPPPPGTSRGARGPGQTTAPSGASRR